MSARIKNTVKAPILVFAVFLLLLLSEQLDPVILQSGDSFYLSMIVLQLLVLVLPGYCYCRIKGNGKMTGLRLRLFSPKRLPFLFYSFGLLITGSALVNVLMYHVFGVEAKTDVSLIPAGSADLPSLLLVAVTFAVIPAFAEEFLFRGVLLAEYAQNGSAAASLAVSLLFAMTHFSLRALPVYFFGGVVFALVTYVSDSVFFAALLHMLYNLFGIFAEEYVWSLIMRPNSLVFFLFVVITLFFVFLLLTLYDAERHYRQLGMAGRESPPEEKRTYYGLRALTDALLSPTFLICVLFFVIVSLISG